MSDYLADYHNMKYLFENKLLHFDLPYAIVIKLNGLSGQTPCWSFKENISCVKLKLFCKIKRYFCS